MQIIGQFPILRIRGGGETQPGMDLMIKFFDCENLSRATYFGVLSKNDEIQGLTNP